MKNKTCQGLVFLFPYFFSFLLFFFFFPSSVLAENSLYYIHQDHLSSTNLVTNRDGEVVSKQNYYPYGSTRLTTGGSTRNNMGDTPTERQYTSQVSDQDQTGLYYYNARYYDPKVALFTQADTNNGPNHYHYVGSNPIKHIDPSGYQSFSFQEDYVNINELWKSDRQYMGNSRTNYEQSKMYPDDIRIKRHYDSFAREIKKNQSQVVDFMDLISSVAELTYDRYDYSVLGIETFRNYNRENQNLTSFKKASSTLDGSSSGLFSLYFSAKNEDLLSLQSFYNNYSKQKERYEKARSKKYQFWDKYYQDDYNKDAMTRAQRDLAVCADIAVLGLYAYKEVLGLNVYLQSVYFDHSGGNFRHANLKAYINNEWYIIDPTWEGDIIKKDDYREYLSKWYDIQGDIEYVDRY